MNLLKSLNATPHITLRDLVKPTLGRAEKAAVRRALKNAQKDQEKLINLAASL